MKKEMLINVSQPEECRIAIIEDGLLEELYIERASQDNLVGNIYKGRVVNLEPSIYLGRSGEIRRSQQIVLTGPCGPRGTTVKWSLRRIDRKRA